MHTPYQFCGTITLFRPVEGALECSLNEKSLLVRRPLKFYCHYEEPIYQFSELLHILTIRNMGFWFRGFIRGNKPKYANFKICPKRARKWYLCETIVYFTTLGIVGHKMWSLFLILGTWSSIFFALQITKNIRFREQLGRKGRKYLEKENMFMWGTWKRKKTLKEGKYSSAEEKENEENILIRKLFL